MRPRSAPLSVVLIAATIATGLFLRLMPLGLPGVIVKHGGSVLWAMMVYWIVSTLRPRWSPPRSAIAAGIVAFTVELAQLYHHPALDAFRTTPAGALLLGRVFSTWDMTVYGLTVMMGAIVDGGVRRRFDRSGFHGGSVEPDVGCGRVASLKTEEHRRPRFR